MHKHNLHSFLKELTANCPNITLREEEPETFGHGHLVLYNDTNATRIAFTEICDRPTDDPDRDVIGYEWLAVRDTDGVTEITALGSSHLEAFAVIKEAARNWIFEQ